ncbi:hypothetical protein [Fusobacterium sp.]|uniref:hypothetical protein n=1 Tax=Fusobacterium sp. TaxID=68766 RepID=UPI0029013D71|nr:hypothetical protein [Fusobacterium sp.]MDU1909711.1 hypothetical protein [Fusobacterium sp.]
MSLTNKLKELIKEMENTRIAMLTEIQQKRSSGKYSGEYIADLTLKTNKEYSTIVEKFEGKRKQLIQDYINEQQGKVEIIPSVEHTGALNSVINLLGSISLEDSELNELAKPFKSNMLLMELLYRRVKTDGGDILEKYNETFKDFKTYTVKREFLKKIKEFENEYFSKSINDANGGLRTSIYLSTLEKTENQFVEKTAE